MYSQHGRLLSGPKAAVFITSINAIIVHLDVMNHQVVVAFNWLVKRKSFLVFSGYNSICEHKTWLVSSRRPVAPHNGRVGPSMASYCHRITDKMSHLLTGET
jgi:hypothetical protein